MYIDNVYQYNIFKLVESFMNIISYIRGIVTRCDWDFSQPRLSTSFCILEESRCSFLHLCKLVELKGLFLSYLCKCVESE